MTLSLEERPGDLRVRISEAELASGSACPSVVVGVMMVDLEPAMVGWLSAGEEIERGGDV